MVPPVPIPNTAVKHPGPMVVATAARVGYRRIFFRKGPEASASGLFACAIFRVFLDRKPPLFTMKHDYPDPFAEFSSRRLRLCQLPSKSRFFWKTSQEGSP